MMTRKTRRRMRVIVARATLSAMLIAALGATGFRSAQEVDAASPQSASLVP